MGKLVLAFANNVLRGTSRPKRVAGNRIRPIIGYGLLLASLSISAANFIQNSARKPDEAYQLLTDVGQGQKIALSEVRRITYQAGTRSLPAAFASTSSLTRLVTRHALRAGQIVQKGDLATPGANSTAPLEMEASFTSDKAPLSSLHPGDNIELVATYGSGSAAISDVVAPSVQIVSISHRKDSTMATGQGRSDLILSLRDPISPLAIAQAESAGALYAIKLSGDNLPSFQGTFSLGGVQPASPLPGRTPS